ncbi:MAG: rod shape-determining protein MreC [Rhodobacter sp.]|nr:rod shape-determining protein MreC [Rhodobacter sp.]MCY4166954.1 rod shape-determining protein MreC [Rhodobacter sp.]MCY4242829.1 rod shape-determining protein MreC [Rhodobacter sp.]
MATFLFWRIDNPRAERQRALIVDQIVPAIDWLLVPVTQAAEMLENLRSYNRIHAQNVELRRELRKMKAWREAALQLEQENAMLRRYNNVKQEPDLTYITGLVVADSGSPFRRSVLLNIGKHDGIVDGWAATDGLGLVGRISGVGNRTSRVILLNDSNSRVPVMIQPSGQRAILTGDDSTLPLLRFIDDIELVRPGDRIVTSGDGGVFPENILVGQVIDGPNLKPRAMLTADFRRLRFVRVLRTLTRERLAEPGEPVERRHQQPLLRFPEFTDG